MPEPTTVWLSRPGRIQDQLGELRIERGEPLFVADDGERIRLGDLIRVRRLRGTPVIEIRYRRHGESRSALLFFERPPPHPDLQVGSRPFARWSTRSLRASEMLRLRWANRRLKPLVKEWAAALIEP